MAWNPHKMLMAGIQCCAFLVKDKSVSFPFVAFGLGGGVGYQICIFACVLRLGPEVDDNLW